MKRFIEVKEDESDDSEDGRDGDKDGGRVPSSFKSRKALPSNNQPLSTSASANNPPSASANIQSSSTGDQQHHASSSTSYNHLSCGQSAQNNGSRESSTSTSCSTDNNAVGQSNKFSHSANNIRNEQNTVVKKRPELAHQGNSSGGGSGAMGQSVVVSYRQKGNPLLKYVRNVRWEYGDLKVDYELGGGAAALFLSLKYHRKHPDYIHTRFNQVRNTYALQVLLLLADIEEARQSVKELNRMCILGGWTMIMAHSIQEAAEYIELYKMTQNRTGDLLRPTNKEKEKDREQKNGAASLLTSIRSVNKTDASRLLEMFGTITNVSRKSEEELSMCPGIAGSKAKKIFKTMRDPFYSSSYQSSK